MHHHHHRTSWLFLLILTLAALLETAPALAGPLVLFDQAHNQKFLIEDKGDLHLSSLAGIVAGSGATVRSSTAPLSDAALQGAAGLVISGAFQPLQEEEIAAVTRFIERGGRLAVMIHIPMPLAPLLEKLGVSYTMKVIREQQNSIDGDGLNFRAVNLTAPELFAGVKQISFYGSWAVMNRDPGSSIVASTSAAAWADMDNDKKLTAKDVVGTFGLAVLGRRGTGRFLVLGDDALLQNRFLDEQNGKFAANLAKWLCSREL